MKLFDRLIGRHQKQFVLVPLLREPHTLAKMESAGFKFPKQPHSYIKSGDVLTIAVEIPRGWSFQDKEYLLDERGVRRARLHDKLFLAHSLQIHGLYDIGLEAAHELVFWGVTKSWESIQRSLTSVQWELMDPDERQDVLWSLRYYASVGWDSPEHALKALGWLKVLDPLSVDSASSPIF